MSWMRGVNTANHLAILLVPSARVLLHHVVRGDWLVKQGARHLGRLLAA